MSSADTNNHPDSSTRTNLHQLFYAAIRFYLDLLGISANVTEELVLKESGERCDLVIEFNAGSCSFAGILYSTKRHMLIEYKSFHYPLDENAFVQTSNYANLFALKIAEPEQMSPRITMSIFGFTIRNWFLQALSDEFDLEKAETGIYDVHGYIRHVFRFVLIEELVGDEYVCLKLLGENPTLDYCNILISQIDYMMRIGNEAAVERGKIILEYACMKCPELVTELKEQGGKQGIMAQNLFTKMFIEAVNSRNEVEKRLSELKQSASKKDETISRLEQNVSGLENDLSEKENTIAFLKEFLPSIDPAVAAAKARQTSFDLNKLL